MILKRDIEQAIESQREQLVTKSGTISRTFLEKFAPTGNHIEVISGVRRCGKSTLMKEIIKNNYQKTAYLNFEDSRIYGFEVADFAKFDEIAGDGIDAWFFDEVQNVSSWEVFIRQLHERNQKVYVTGSNAALLSRELGTRLTGRNIRHTLFPFSYAEFLRYKMLENNAGSFGLYLIKGGFPEYLDSENPEVLQNLLKDIIFRDIAIRHGLRNTGSLMDISLYLLSNIGKEFSYNNLRKIFAVGSANTISDYLSWLTDSYLLFYLQKFSWSAKSMAVNPRKVYAVDNGLITCNTLSFNQDSGRLLENAVFLYLMQQNYQFYYFRERNECDFVVFENRKCIMALQMCETLNQDNLSRETDGVIEAVKFFGTGEACILTQDQHDEIVKNGILIKILPVYQFITSKSS